jgi:ferric-dicitrate binding protein FerR (iron transport regulator)
MSRDDDMYQGHEEFGPDERAELEALRKLPRQDASAELRASARSVFMEGAASHQIVRARAQRPRRTAISTLVALAAVVALFFFASVPRGTWTIVDIHMADEVLVDGEAPVVGATVAGGPVRTTPCSEVELAFEDRLHLRFLSDASAELPEAPGRWLNRDRTLWLDQGEVYGSTGGEALDFRLRLQTDEASALLTGTTFAVIRLEDATCFCLYSGSIEFTSAGAEQSVSLPVGQRVFIYKDGREPVFEPLTDRERMKLQMLHDAVAEDQ